MNHQPPHHISVANAIKYHSCKYQSYRVATFYFKYLIQACQADVEISPYRCFISLLFLSLPCASIFALPMIFFRQRIDLRWQQGDFECDGSTSGVREKLYYAISASMGAAIESWAPRKTRVKRNDRLFDYICYSATQQFAWLIQIGDELDCRVIRVYRKWKA